MIRIIIAVLLILTYSKSQLINIPLIISDGGVNGADTLYFGVDPAGTENIDTILGEYQLPPAPPSGVFDCRFIGNDLTPPLQFGQGLNRDYRFGNESFAGSILHEIKFQKGSGILINIHWNLPNGITGRLYDLFGGVIVNDSIYGNGNINITNSGINRIFMRINYAPGSIGIKNISREIPVGYKLYQNFPNPFNPNTKIRFAVPKQVLLKLTVYDVTGKTISVLVSNNIKPGAYEVEWFVFSGMSGVYYCRMETENYSATKKMIILK